MKTEDTFFDEFVDIVCTKREDTFSDDWNCMDEERRCVYDKRIGTACTNREDAFIDESTMDLLLILESLRLSVCPCVRDCPDDISCTAQPF